MIILFQGLIIQEIPSVANWIEDVLLSRADSEETDRAAAIKALDVKCVIVYIWGKSYVMNIQSPDISDTTTISFDDMAKR